MKAPRLTRLATFETKTVTQDPVYGTDVVTWAPLVYLPGSPAVAEQFRVELQDVLPSRAEANQGGLRVATNPSRLRMRWRNDVDSSMRVTVHGESDVVYQIVSGPAEILGRKNYIEFMVERYSSAGDAP